MRPQFRTCSPFCFSCKLSNPLYFYLFYFFPLSSSLLPLCLPPHSLLLRWLSQPTGRAPAASCPPRFPSIPPPPPLPVQASTTSRRYPNLSSSPDLSSCCLLSFLCFIYLFFCSLVWVYKSNCAPLDLRRISTCPYLWMMMILLVNQCRLLAPAATLPSSFIFFSLRSDTQKFYTSAAFHLHSQCHLFSITHSLSLFFKGLSQQGYDTICCLRMAQTEQRNHFSSHNQLTFSRFAFSMWDGHCFSKVLTDHCHTDFIIEGKKIILNTYIFDKGRTLTFKHFSHRIPSSKWVFLGVLVRNDKTFVSLIVFVMFLRVLLPSKWKVSCQRKSVKPVLVFLTCCKYCV